MSPASNNEPASLTHNEDACGDTPKVELLCEETPGKLPGEAVLRRDIASGGRVDTARLIRFVVAPDGDLTPDLAQKLPGRGMWLNSDRSSLELAIKRNLFSKAAKRQVKAHPELVARVHLLLRRRCLDLLGLARREGGALNGFEKVLSSVKSGKVGWLIEASDGAEDGRNKMLAAARAVGVPVAGCFTNVELSLAMGQDNAIHAALLSGRRVQRWSAEMNRLAGFEPLIPPDWQLYDKSSHDPGGTLP